MNQLLNNLIFKFYLKLNKIKYQILHNFEIYEIRLILNTFS